MIDVVGAAIQRGDTFLVCRRRVERGGLWEFPGGKVETGENHQDALAREILEELRVRVRVGAFIATFEDVDADIRLTTYRAELIDTEPTASTDHDRLEWLAPEEFGVRTWAVADLATVQRLVAEQQ